MPPRKRRFQKGTLRKKDGSWQLKYSPIPGKATTKTLGRAIGPDKITKSEAERQRMDFMSKFNAGPDERRRMATVREFVESTFLPLKKENGKWRERTAKDTEARIRRYILPVLGDKRLGDLEPEDLENLLRRMRDRILGRQSLTHTRNDLKAICSMAWKRGYLSLPVHDGLQVPTPNEKARKRASVVVNRADYMRAQKALPEEDGLAFDLVMYGGLRPSEVYALQCGDVTPLGLFIRRSFYKGTVNPTKVEEATRLVGLPAAKRERLAKWIAELPANGADAWVFPNIDVAGPRDPDNSLDDRIKPALKPLGLDWITFAVVRRSKSTHAKSIGIDPRLVADQQGHGIGTHVRIYEKSNVDDLVEAEEKLYAWFNEVNPE